jgi:maltooligosyltrehalose trehalohydrolase
MFKRKRIMNIGAIYRGDNKCFFKVWSPWANDIKVKISPDNQVLQLEKEEDYWSGEFEEIPPGTKYMYRINNGFDRPDPASNYQPYDVHSESEVVDHSAYKWNDSNWIPWPLEDYIIYEMHIGTFTPEGTFEAAIEKISHLKNLGITAVEIMPVSQFPGDRNWGYDGVSPFAPQNSYGGPEGLKKLVDTFHQNKISVILDVVYNHLGPEGNYLNQYAPYFTSKYQTPWGNALNFDGEYSDEVKKYFIQNALYWFEHFHFDGLRLDAIDKIVDTGAKHFLQELVEEVKNYSEKTGVKKILIAESDLNDEKIIRPVEQNGYGMDAQWSDDFHHSLHALLTGERDGYYSDFGSKDDLINSMTRGFVYNGKYSKYRKRRHGNDVSKRDLKQFIICSQNHDQVGNRAFGERLSTLISFESYKLAACLVVLTPFTPMLFMGQEFYETAPFQYFISHSDPELIKAVQKGRRDEFRQFNWEQVVPDPFAEETFLNSKLQWDNLQVSKNLAICELHKKLIEYRKNNSVFKENTMASIKLDNLQELDIILFTRCSTEKSLFGIINLEPETITTLINVPAGNWRKVFDTASEEWFGSGTAIHDTLIGKEQNMTLKRESFILFESEI